jgi:hypothetical protein
VIYFFFWLVSVSLGIWGGYRLGWRDAEYVQRTFKGIDRLYLSARARGFK